MGASRTFVGNGDGDVTFNIRYSPGLNTPGLVVTAQIFGPTGAELVSNLTLAENTQVPGLYQTTFVPAAGQGDYVILVTAPAVQDRVESVFKIQPAEALFSRIDLNIKPTQDLVNQVIQRVAGQASVPLTGSNLISGELDMRLEMRSLLERDGFFVIHRQIDHTQRCACVDKNLEADPNCPRCAGMGFKYNDQIVLTYGWQRGSYLGANLTTDLSKLNTHDAVFYFNFDTEIRESDIIVELIQDLDGNLEVPHRIKRMYDVATAFPRIERGAVQFWEVYCNEKHWGK